MARPKGSKTKKKQEPADPNVDSITEEWVEFECPVRGRIRQKVKVKKLKKVTNKQFTFMGGKDLIEDLESKEGDQVLVEQEVEE